MPNVRIPLGDDAKLYIGESKTEVSIARNVSLELSTDEADVTTRGSGGWKEVVPTSKSASIDFDLVWDVTNEAFVELMRAFFFRKTLLVIAADGTYTEGTAGTGLKAYCSVFKWSKNEKNGDIQTVSVSMKPTYAGSTTEYKPTWLKDGVELTDSSSSSSSST